MGKNKKKAKLTNEELMDTVEFINNERREKEKNAKIATEDLFTTNTAKDGLKAKREKLKADRFKETLQQRTSKTETVLIKRMVSKMENREKMGLEPVKKSVIPKSRKFNHDDTLGDLEDIWATPKEVVSKKFQRYVDGFAKKDTINVKQVVKPQGGQSYNPSIKDHKNLLKKVSVVEEDGVKKNLKELARVLPITYADREIQAAEPAEGEEEESEVDSSEEEIDMDKPLAVNDPIDRLDIKTQTQRNRDMLSKLKQQKIKEEVEKRKFAKDIERLENLTKQAENEAKQSKNRIELKNRKHEEEVHKQEVTGLISKPKKLGRFKYKQRKTDYQLEEELSGNLRQLKPLGGDLLLQDRFDSIFRRNLVEPDAPAQNEKKRQRKLKYKMYSAIGTTVADLHASTQELKRKNDEKEKGLKHLLNSDVIQI